MYQFSKTILFCLAMLFSALVFSESENSNNAVTNDEVKVPQEMQRQINVYENASSSPAQFRARLKEDCSHFNSILLDTAETIQLGTRVFNAGGAGLTVRIYEGTTYKILYTIQNDCGELSDALQAGIYLADNEKRYKDKAWALRNTLDLIMGGPPVKPPGGA